MKKLTPLLVALLCMVVTSCSSKKTMLPYFTDLSGTKGELPAMEYQPKIQPDDELLITVTSQNPIATAEFNVPIINRAANEKISASAIPSIQTYRVDSHGDINFPVFGKIHVAGMTIDELSNYLTEKISVTVKDPMVYVDMVDFNVVVAGEVNHPQKINVKGQRITLLDALAQAGGMTAYGERNNVLILREEDGKRVYARVNLNDSEVLTSPYYYLQPKDYIYVSPNAILQANSKYNQDNAFKLSVISTIVSASSVIASLIIALVVK